MEHVEEREFVVFRFLLTLPDVLQNTWKNGKKVEKHFSRIRHFANYKMYNTETLMQEKEHIWYASYGSNLCEERFLCYILGGQPKNATKTYSGCNDKTLPIANKEIYICHEMYFAKNSGTWDNGGVAFIKVGSDEQQQTFGRMYLITKGQFIEIIKQEINFHGDITIDFNKAISEGSLVFKRESWYGNIIYLGNQICYPIFTFTNSDNISPPTKPSDKYLTTIIRGIHEVYKHLNANDIFDYLISRQGVADNYSKDCLKKVVENSFT